MHLVDAQVAFDDDYDLPSRGRQSHDIVARAAKKNILFAFKAPSS